MTTLSFKLATGEIVFLEPDACVSENFTGDASATDHPIEGGSNVNDHIRPASEQVSLSLRVSNDPISALAPTNGASLAKNQIAIVYQGARYNQGMKIAGPTIPDIRILGQALPQDRPDIRLPDEVNQAVTEYLNLEGWDKPTNRILSFFTILRSAKNRGQLWTVTTSLAVYENMAIVSLEVPRDVKTTRTATFNLRLSEMTIISTDEVKATAPKAKKKDQTAEALKKAKEEEAKSGKTFKQKARAAINEKLANGFPSNPFKGAL